jgi:hypothetical protein
VAEAAFEHGGGHRMPRSVAPAIWRASVLTSKRSTRPGPGSRPGSCLNKTRSWSTPMWHPPCIWSVPTVAACRATTAIDYSLPVASTTCRRQEIPSDSGGTILLASMRPGADMSEAARDESRDRVDDLLDGRPAALRPEADRLRAALLRGESPESLGLAEDGLTRVLEERGLV